MTGTNRIVLALAALTALLAFGWVARSGDLNPPGGPVSPTGRTLDEIYSAASGAGGHPVPPREIIVVRIDDGSDVYTGGDLLMQGFEDFSQVFNVEGLVSRPVQQGGVPTGGRVYDLVRISKQIDAATPRLINALASNTTLDVVIDFYRLNSQTAQLERYFTVELTDAVVAEHIIGSVGLGEDTVTHETEVAFAFAQITWTHVPTGISYTDTISQPAAQ